MADDTYSRSYYNDGYNYRSNHTYQDVNIKRETAEMSERREKYELIQKSKTLKVVKYASIAAALAAGAGIGLTALGVLPLRMAPIATQLGAISLLGGASYLVGKVSLNSMLDAASSESIGDIADEIKRGER